MMIFGRWLEGVESKQALITSEHLRRHTRSGRSRNAEDMGFVARCQHYRLDMADHEIRVRLPAITLGGPDVTIEVRIDGAKRGELRISEGGVDWWPRSAKTNYKSKTWEQLAAFLEG